MALPSTIAAVAVNERRQPATADVTVNAALQPSDGRVPHPCTHGTTLNEMVTGRPACPFALGTAARR